ncbi:hypothetical protein SDC9_210729 [bioreactor metagenome]|uniref:Uncharacterized protein n=1 Tax=bioreactor metagenome TaxID=1076179 RepID=A0A645JHR7_9ZZZZ
MAIEIGAVVIKSAFPKKPTRFIYAYVEMPYGYVRMS